MDSHPEVKPGSFINVNGIKCIVRSLCTPTASLDSVCIAIFDEGKPTSHEVGWNGSSWYFPERNDFGGYVERSDPLLKSLRYEKSRGPF